jgi:DNA-binding beta-propeller fold protein YncE
MSQTIVGRFCETPLKYSASDPDALQLESNGVIMFSRSRFGETPSKTCGWRDRASGVDMTRLKWPIAFTCCWCLIAGRPAQSADDYQLKKIPLTGATDSVALDDFAYDHAKEKLWVPASNLAAVDVIDAKTDAISQVTGFITSETERRGRKFMVGPTAITLADGVAYVGNRGDAAICTVNTASLERGECVPISSDSSLKPDTLTWVAMSHEIWVNVRPLTENNAEAAKSIQVFDATDRDHPKLKTKIALTGFAEGYAVDNQRGIFYTNVEEIGKTVAIDIRTHQIVATWDPGSKEVGGLALDSKRNFLLVACGDHVVSMDAGHGGKVLGSIPTGAGVDLIGYSAEKGLLYAAAGQAATLTIASLDDSGKFHLTATVPTTKGARCVVAGSGETAYLIDPPEGAILKVSHK